MKTNDDSIKWVVGRLQVLEALEDRIFMHEATCRDATQDQEDRNEAMVRVSEARMCWHTVRALEVQNENK